MSHITQPEGGAPASSQTPALFSAKRVRIQHIARAKAEGIPLTMLTAYDALTAPILEAAGVDMLLVGDSLGNVILGHSSTLPVTLEDMERATAAVARSTSRAMIVADLPFGTYEDTVEHAFASATHLMKAGAHAVKLEGGRSRAHIIAGLVSAGIPVCAHLGYTPQSENTLGGPRMQGRGDDADALRRVFDEVGIAFLFANKMHPSMRFAAPVRRALGFPTAFNVLGPLTNPARVQACAIGESREENARLMAGVYASRGLSALVFRGANTGLDELTTTDANQVWLVSGGAVVETEFDARESLGMASSSIEDLAGGEAAENADVARDVLSGGGADAVRDAVALNVGAGILAWEGLDNPVTPDDFEQRMRGAVERALAALADGSGARLIERWVAASNA